jgi:hypothetical protein
MSIFDYFTLQRKSNLVPYRSTRLTTQKKRVHDEFSVRESNVQNLHLPFGKYFLILRKISNNVLRGKQ